MAGEILTGGLLVAFMRYGDLWRKLRRAAHEGLNIQAVKAYQPLQEAEAITLVSDFLEDPHSWDDHLRRSAASTVASAVYGRRPIQSKDDPIIKRINDLMHRLVRAALPGAYLVEIFPSMRYLPTWMAKWKADGLKWHEQDTLMFEGLMDEVRQRWHNGQAPPCFATHLLHNKEHVLSTKETAWLSGTMFGAGAETTAAATAVFMLAMVLYPDIMKKAQAEIDELVGPHRLPTFADRSRLPYINAIVKEVLRWRPVGPLGLPRRSLQDDWYKGWFIPKGTLVIYNTWAMNRDPEVFPDFDEFRPERFLDISGQAEYIPTGAHAQGHSTYGFGKRICSGMNIANQALFIDFACLLWAVNIQQAHDREGNPIIPSRTDVVDEGLVVRPVPFECHITPRSSDRASVVQLARGRVSPIGSSTV